MKRPSNHALNGYIGRKITELRIQCGENQTQLATVLNLTFQQVQKFENGKNAVKFDYLLQIAAHYQVPLTIFIPDGISSVPPASQPGSRLVMDVCRHVRETKQEGVLRAVLNLLKAIKYEHGSQAEAA